MVTLRRTVPAIIIIIGDLQESCWIPLALSDKPEVKRSEPRQTDSNVESVEELDVISIIYNTPALRQTDQTTAGYRQYGSLCV